jgi:hypothetical protein
MRDVQYNQDGFRGANQDVQKKSEQYERNELPAIFRPLFQNHR